MKIHPAAIFVLLSLMLVSVCVSADMYGRGKGFEEGLFWGADLDRNLRIDRNEAKAVYNLAEDEIFTRFDEDHNGFITRFEFMEFIQHAPWVDKFVHPEDME